MSQQTSNLNIEAVIGWLDGEIQSIEKQEPLAVQEDAQGPQDNVMIAAGKAFQESKDGTEKINLPPDVGKRKGKETVALPFLRRKAVNEDAKEGEEEDDKAVEKVDANMEHSMQIVGGSPSSKQTISLEASSVEKSIDGLKTWAFIEKAMGDCGESSVSDSIILQDFNLPGSTEIETISDGTLLKEVLTSDSRPSERWWSSCIELALGIPDVSEVGAFGATLYHRTNEFNLSDFIEKNKGDDTSESGINITVSGYKTKNFDICPGSVAAFRKIEEYISGIRDPELRESVTKAVKKTDQFLGLEKTLLERGKADPNDIERMIQIYGQVAYLVGCIAEKLGRSLRNEFIFAVDHIAKVLPLMESGMALEKSSNVTLSNGVDTTTTATTATAIYTSTDNTFSTSVSGNTVILERGEDGNEVDNLIYTEDDDVELCQKCASDIEKCGHKQDRKDLESPSESGPMDRAESRPNVIMRDQACGCDHPCPPPCQCGGNLAKEEIVPPDHIAAKNVKRSKLPDSSGPRGDAAENIGGGGADVPEGFGLSEEEKEYEKA